MQIRPVVREVVDRISHQLSGAVESNVSPAFYFEEFNTLSFQLLRRGREILDMKRTSHCHYGRMFDQQQHVAVRPAIDPGLSKSAL